MKQWLVTKYAHAISCYRRGRSVIPVPGGDVTIAGAVMLPAYLGNVMLTSFIFAATAMLFTTLGYLDQKKLHLWQAESSFGWRMCPEQVEIYNGIKEILGILRRDPRSRVLR